MRISLRKSKGYPLALVAMFVLLAPQVIAQGPYADDAAKVRTPTWMTHRASFRVLGHRLVGGDLGPGESPIPGAITVDGSEEPIDSMSWANIRLRYDGKLNIGARFGVHLGLDALDNIALGTGPQSAMGWHDGLWLDGQQPPSSTGDAFRDSLRVRQLYGSWRVMNWVDVAGGRMNDHFGLGLQRNWGACEDCGRSTLIDGVRVAGSAMKMNIEFALETAVTGATTEDPDLPMGQPLDLSEQDDVSTFVFRIGQGSDRRKEMYGQAPAVPVGGSTFDWQFFTSTTEQLVSSSEPAEAALGSACETERVTAGGVTSQPQDCWELLRRGASLWRPGLWTRARWRPDPVTTVRVEAEASGLFGDLAAVQRLDGSESDAKSLSGFGLALETEVDKVGWAFGVDAGFATGDDGRYLGYLDGQNLAETGEDLEADQRTLEDPEITSFWFNRDYHLDLILFQRILGGVTNAIYAKPWVSGVLLDTETARLGARLDVLYAAAARPSGSPGQGKHYGVEIDGRVSLELPEGFAFEIAGGVLVPMDALQGRVSGESAEPATLVRGLLSWRFQ